VHSARVILTDNFFFLAKENFSNCAAGIGPHHAKLSDLGDKAPEKFPSLFCTMNLKQQINLTINMCMTLTAVLFFARGRHVLASHITPASLLPRLGTIQQVQKYPSRA